MPDDATTATTDSQLAEALSKFQANIPVIPKDQTANVTMKGGGSYQYSYADLASITRAAFPELAKHGLSFTTIPRRTDKGLELVGRLMHTSGESIEGSLPITGSTPQDIGSSLTYMRRYLFGCLTGVVTDDDDDGQLAQAQHQSRRQQDEEAALDLPTLAQNYADTATRLLLTSPTDDKAFKKIGNDAWTKNPAILQTKVKGINENVQAYDTTLAGYVRDLMARAEAKASEAAAKAAESVAAETEQPALDAEAAKDGEAAKMDAAGMEYGG